MTKASSSTEQQLLPAEWTRGFFEESLRKEGISTGELLKEREPEKYEAILEALKNGVGILKIKKFTGAHPRTIMAIRDANIESIEIAKQQLAKRFRYISHLCAESIAEDLEDDPSKIPAQQRSIIMAISFDKAQVIEGAPTSIIGKPDKTAPTHDDFLRHIEGLRSGKAEGMGLPGTESGTKGELPADADSADRPGSSDQDVVEPDLVIGPDGETNSVGKTDK